MGNCLVGRNNENVVEQEEQYEEVMKKDYKRKDRKVKIVLIRAELEKLILFQLNADGANKGGDASLASFGDFLKELEEERLAGEAAAAEEEKSRQRLCRRWKPSLKSVIEWPEEWEMSRHPWTSDLHRQFADTVEELGVERVATPRSILESGLTVSEERQARLREIIRRQTQLHLRQYERLQKIVDNIQNPQRQEEEMDKSTIEVGESSSGTQQISCKSLYQSSRIGLNESDKDEEDTDNNDDNMS